MQSIKLWSLFLPVVLCILNNEEVSTLQKNIGTHRKFTKEYIIGGFIGCLYDDVCLQNEVCINDFLFGKCIASGIELQSSLAQGKLVAERSEFGILSLKGNEINWRDAYVQCVVRTLMHHLKQGLFETGPEKLCGKVPKRSKQNYETGYQLSPYDDEDQVFGQHLLQQTEYLKPEIYNIPSSEKFPKLAPKIFLSPDDFDRIDESNLDVLWNKIKTFQNDQIKETWQGNIDDNIPLDYEDLDSASLSKIHNKQAHARKLRSEFLKRRYGLRLPDEPENSKTRIRSWVWIRFKQQFHSGEAERYLRELSNRLQLASPITHFFHDRTGIILHFQVPTARGFDAISVIDALRQGKGNFNGYMIEDVGFGRGAPVYKTTTPLHSTKDFPISLTVFFSVVGFVLLLGLVYTINTCCRMRKTRAERKAHEAMLIDVEHKAIKRKSNLKSKNETSSFRTCFASLFKSNEKSDNEKDTVTEGLKPMPEQTTGHTEVQALQSRSTGESFASSNLFSPGSKQPLRMQHNDSIGSQRSSTSSWSSEPVACGIDLTTGHLILSYMEGYLQDEDKLTTDWNAVNAYTSEEATPCADAQKPENLLKNRIVAPPPYEQSRVRLRNSTNDYINASLLYDHTPRNPVYIATPTPLLESLADFWEMVWEQSSFVIVCLERPNEMKQPVEIACDLEMTDVSLQYWPSEGIQTFGDFEVHLVSEHSSCENYVVRSFYLKNLASGETRTVTQFHYLTWSDTNLKAQTNALLEFRRKVNRSFRGLMSPIVVHCLDGSGRSGAYILLDLVLNRIAKGVKEINIAASLEHIRDQRQGMVQKKEQYEFVFMAVAKEVDAMLKVTGQNN